MGKKRNVVLYLDAELVRKTRELGFNLSKTCENHLKQLITHFSVFNQLNNCSMYHYSLPLVCMYACEERESHKNSRQGFNVILGACIFPFKKSYSTSVNISCI